MAKRKTSKRRIRRRTTKKSYRRKKDRRIPLLPTIGFGAPLLTGKPWGWSSPIEAIQQGNGAKAIQSAIANLTGVQVGMPNTGFTSGVNADLARIINPFDLEVAGAMKGLLWGTVGSKLATKFGLNRYMKKVPFLGNKVKL